jgi:hypothetical protein
MPIDIEMNEAALESRARRAAKRIGLKARRSRWRRDSIDNLGGFMLVDPDRNMIVAGSRYDLTPEDVIKICSK